MLYQIDIVKRVPLSSMPSGYYYWTSVYYYDLSDFPGTREMWLRAFVLDSLASLDVVEYQKAVLKTPPGRANIVATIPLTPNLGLIPSGGADYSLLIVGYLRTFYTDGTHSYRYWRAPALLDWVDAGAFSPYAIAVMDGYSNNLGPSSATRKSRNLYGATYSHGITPRYASGWQLRHGTKRRERVL